LQLILYNCTNMLKVKSIQGEPEKLLA